MRICDLLLGSPPDQARLVGCRTALGEAGCTVGGGCRARDLADIGCASQRLGARQHQQAIFFGSIYAQGGGEARGSNYAAAANGVRWGSYSMLVATVSHFSDLKTELEVLRPGRNADLREDEADAL
jgi:hypothetical protein